MFRYQVTGLVNVVSSSLHTLPLLGEQLGVDTCDVLSIGASHGSHVAVSSHLEVRGFHAFTNLCDVKS